MKKTEKPKKQKAATRRPAAGKAADGLRKKAEAMVDKLFGKEKVENTSNREAQRLIHELKTHQVELELQNEELRDAQLSLEDAKKRYSDLYDFAPVGYFTLDGKGFIREANLAVSAMLGVDRARLIGSPLISFIGTNKSAGREWRTIFAEHMRSVMTTGRRRTCEIKLTRKDGKEFDAAMESVPAEDGSCRTAVIDITERKKAEESMKTSNDELKMRTAELESLNKELEAFSYVVSHDLKAPVRHMRGFAKVVLEDYGKLLDEAGRDYLNRIVSAGDRMAELIDALLTMARQTSPELRENPVNLSEIADVAAQELKMRQPERDVEFIIQQGVKTNGDLTMLRTVMVNLFDNAWKFTSKTEGARIEFGSMEDPQHEGPVYYVRDNGAGFDMRYADRMFMPFHRLHMEGEFPGLGIGLAIVERIIHRHGGKIWSEGEKGKGATIFFTLGQGDKSSS